MSSYHFGPDHGPDGPGGRGRTRTPYADVDLPALMHVADRFTEALHAEYPRLVSNGEVVQRELARSAEDGLPPNRGRIRTALENVAIGAAAGTASLIFTQQLTDALGL
ncbi:hypothetical protein ACIQVT_19700 [Streptomyces sp. NPDC100445]|uniref:hypothetical protein n=1 Tax=Streptomyces sp. NPDC100445 TaxID=3366102 RepID=UPI003810F8F0